MSFVAYLERISTEKGLEKGLEKGERIGLLKAIVLGLDLKFGQEGVALTSQVEKVEELAILQAIYDAIKPATSLDDIRKLIPASTTDPR